MIATAAREPVPEARAAHTRHPGVDAAVAGDGIPDFCRTCALFHACAMVGFGKPELSSLHGLMRHLGPYRAGEVIFREGQPFDAVFAVRAGMVKTRQLDRERREHVLGFHLPGEVVGLNAIYPERFPCDVVALDDAFLCRFSFTDMSMLAARRPVVQQHLFRLLSRELGNLTAMVGDHTATERLAAFLVDLGERHALRGSSGTAFRLSMSRGDIASHLRLAAETVSRVLQRFRKDGLVAIEGREIELLDPAELRRLGRCLLRARP